VTQTEDLFPSGTTGTQATALATDLVTAANTGDLATARSKAFALTELTLSEYAAGHLSDPASTLPDRLDTYITDIFSKASLGAPPLSASSFGPEGIVAVVRPAGGTFINSSLRAGIAIPDGALTEPTLLVADRLPDASAWAHGAGPLPTSLTQYPLYFEFTTTPEATLSADATLGTCQVTDPANPYYAPDDAYARLQLAHTDPANPGSIELLERVDPTFLNCTGATANAIRTGGRIAALTARAGGIGGRVRKFSPFGAVDPEQSNSGSARAPLTSGTKAR
jgi:hypothetical protein